MSEGGWVGGWVSEHVMRSYIVTVYTVGPQYNGTHFAGHLG